MRMRISDKVRKGAASAHPSLVTATHVDLPLQRHIAEGASRARFGQVNAVELELALAAHANWSRHGVVPTPSVTDIQVVEVHQRIFARLEFGCRPCCAPVILADGVDVEIRAAMKLLNGRTVNNTGIWCERQRQAESAQEGLALRSELFLATAANFTAAEALGGCSVSSKCMFDSTAHPRSNTSPNGSAPGQRRHGPDSKRGDGDGSLQGNQQHTPPAPRPALGCSGAQGWWGVCDTQPDLALVAPAAPDFCSEDYESLRPSAGRLRVACDFASAHRDRRFEVARGSVDNEVEAATVVGVNLRRCFALQPLLRHDPSVRTDRFASDLNPRPFNDETTPGQQARAWAGEVMVPVCIDLKPTSVSAFNATAQGREGQGQPKAASQARRQNSDLASSSPVVSLAGSLVAQQAFNCRPDRIVVTASVRQDVGWGYVAEQMLCTRRCAESEQKPGALDIGELHELPK
ncbi:hypothetical protein AK812_SmicGene9090 [Symbiodinium microadriaticum]|uniref:Uncharacterized protein n=1 Tax=Symbiodinium microadriaticum TaxID=2951 RepID=A0A1Q9EJ78_SYMMI|nr:hypothetical protein AK812_SmicGene9090 [Symbiodinium microadriaticum]